MDAKTNTTLHPILQYPNPKSRMPWFRCYPTKLLGALSGMSADEQLVYMTVLLRIYETGGPLVESAQSLARRTGLTEKRVYAALESLLAWCFLRDRNGAFSNRFCEEEILHQFDVSEAAKTNAKRRWKNSEQYQQNVPCDGITSVEPPVCYKDIELDRDIESKKESNTPSAVVYKFQKGKVRLTAEDFGRWEKAFSEINLLAELEAAYEWAAAQPNWFVALKAIIAKRNREAIERQKAIKIGIAAGQKKVVTGGGWA